MPIIYSQHEAALESKVFWHYLYHGKSRGTSLYLVVPWWVRAAIQDTSADPSDTVRSERDVLSWANRHLIFNDAGEIVGVIIRNDIYTPEMF